MCNLYSMTSNPQAIREIGKVLEDRTGNLQLLPEIWPNTMAPVVRNGDKTVVNWSWRAGACRHRPVTSGGIRWIAA